ncbi:MAG TPA: hypothetical protein VF665_15505 [Longimicrobium sp.]|uniref:hypothetical protein n=1 Tax=Longimicrobium sp. TaxID=2029185 RepID=UPI002ED7EC4C
MTLTYIMFGLLLIAPIVAAFRGGLGEYGVALFTLLPAVLGVLAWFGLWEAHLTIEAGRAPAGPGRMAELLIELGRFRLPLVIFLGIIVLSMLFVAGSNALEAGQESRRTGSTLPTTLALASQLGAAAVALWGGWGPADPSRLLAVALLVAASVAATFRIIPEPDLPPIRAGSPQDGGASQPAADVWNTFR